MAIRSVFEVFILLIDFGIVYLSAGESSQNLTTVLCAMDSGRGDTRTGRGVP